MLKILKIALILIIILAIFVPEAQILASAGSLDGQTDIPSSYIPKGSFSKTIGQIPGRFIKYVVSAVPQTIKNSFWQLQKTSVYKNFEIFANGFISALGEIWNLILNLLLRLYKNLYPGQSARIRCGPPMANIV